MVYQPAATAAHINYRAHVDPVDLKDGNHTNMIALPGTGLYFGDWTLGADGSITAVDDPADNVSFSSEGVNDTGILQRAVTDASGNSYIQLIIAEEIGSIIDDVNYNNYNGVGLFSETYIKVGGINDLSSYQGMRCLASCLADYTAHPDTQFESSSKIQLGDSLGNDAEKVRIKMLKWDSPSGDPWVEFGAPEAAGFTNYTDVWRANYDTGIDDGTATFTNLKADFIRVSIITEDIDPYYSYTNKQHYFNVGETSPNEINFDNPNSAKDDLAQSMVDAGFSTTLTEAIDYIEDYMEYTVLAANGFRLSQEGLEVHDVERTVMQGAVVKAGSIEYLNSGEATNPTVSWQDGDTIFNYSVHEELDLDYKIQHLYHREVQNRTTPTDPFESKQSRYKALYLLEENALLNDTHDTVDEFYDPGVGNQFVIEVTDLIDPFNPW